MLVCYVEVVFNFVAKVPSQSFSYVFLVLYILSCFKNIYYYYYIIVIVLIIFRQRIV